MRINGRKGSKNVEDQRAYFGSVATDSDYPNEDRYADFVTSSLLHPYLDGPPQKFSNNVGLSISDVINALIAEKLPGRKKVFGLNIYHGSLFPSK